MIRHCRPGSEDTLPSDSLDSECCDHQEKSVIGRVKESLHSSPSLSSVPIHLVQTFKIRQNVLGTKTGAGFKYQVAKKKKKKPNIDCIIMPVHTPIHAMCKQNCRFVFLGASVLAKGATWALDDCSDSNVVYDLPN